MNDSKADLKKVGEELLKKGGSVNLVNLVLLLVIGWNARGAMGETLDMAQQTVSDMTTVKSDMDTVKSELASMREAMGTVNANTARTQSNEEDLRVLKGQMSRVIECVRQRRWKACQI